MSERVAAQSFLELAPNDRGAWVLARRLGLMLAGSLAIAAAAHVAIPLPFTPVPFTLQPLAVLLVGMLFGPALAFTTVALYLVEGAAGLPVFQPLGMGGVAQLAGPTGGFLLAYPFVATLTSWLYRTLRFDSDFGRAVTAGTVGTSLLFLVGAIRLASVLHLGIYATLLAAVVPFLPGEMVKVLAAAGCTSAWFSRHSK